jgi:hypothetical protein
MPSLDISREHLEDLIQAVMYARLNIALDSDPEVDPDTDFLIRLAEVHLKLEDALDLWINGGIVDIPIPAHLQGMGIAGIQKVYPPHDEGVAKGD